MEERICEYSKCKQPFSPKKYNQRFCQPSHKIEAWLEKKSAEKDVHIARLNQSIRDLWSTCDEKDKRIVTLEVHLEGALKSLEQGDINTAIDRLKAAIGKNETGKEVIQESIECEALVV